MVVVRVAVGGSFGGDLGDGGAGGGFVDNLLHLGGLLTYTPHTITVTLDQPATPRLTQVLTLLLDEINTTPPRLPGDPRPITYQLTTT